MGAVNPPAASNSLLNCDLGFGVVLKWQSRPSAPHSLHALVSSVQVTFSSSSLSCPS